MSKINLHGIFPPIPTPFINGNIAYDELAANIEKWSKTGLKGLVAMGSNGEYVYLSAEEKREFVAKVVEMSPDHMLVIAGTGCESTKETIELTRDCAARGAHAALVVSPYYYGGRMNEAALIAYFTAVADHSPIPILLYNVPKFTHINMTSGLVAQLSRHPNIVGIKDSTGNVIQLGEYANHVTAGFNLLVGTAGALLGALALGCVGGVLALANVPPQICVRIYQLVQDAQKINVDNKANFRYPDYCSVRSFPLVHLSICCYETGDVGYPEMQKFGFPSFRECQNTVFCVSIIAV